MNITTQLNYENYAALMVQLFYKRGLVIATVVLGAIFFLIGILALVFLYDKVPFLYMLIFIGVGLWLVVLPYVTVKIKSKRDFYSNQMLQQKMEYEFLEDKIILRGDTFSTEMQWAKLHKVVETKDWLLLYQSNSLANLIPKESIGEQLVELKALIASQQGLHQELV
ncbi:Hypothetical protein I595_956 [Croceitalea dokdonensis DOKDO 023]|uniref:YcxB-like C-terminal domain-containing protein n=1 Tax=Croceitalea dokdonensis DOKDO 023 TaxID=1300341 RepID=A0A0P7AVC1_9FLAO|nr:YcxB family protein [Croceitalea dokdonensis]KPM32538.1 Hypothetical protein I595_956 [Croceitalea dokdonensis DOKDO 023]